MTSNRASECTRLGARHLLMVMLLGLLGACASLPDDAPVVEQLDEETGLTIVRLGRPLELYVDTARPDPAERFGFLGPFETNQMGKRDSFLWLALPVESNTSPPKPTIIINGSALELADPGHDAEFAGLRKSPYRISTPWMSMYYFRIDAAAIEHLGQAQNLSVQVTDIKRDGPVELSYSAQLAGDTRLREFAAH